MDKFFESHISRLRTAVLQKESAKNVANWVPKHTFIGIGPFSYAKHEYQQRILEDQSSEVIVKKCSQVGISEVSVRKALALVNILDPYTVCYTLPTAKFATLFTQTRIDPVIENSKTMVANQGHGISNAEVKRFGNSFLHIKGSASANAPISIPVDHLIHDELDFSDQEVIGQYTSRLTHSEWKRVDKFSTPTVPKYGVSQAFMDSRRHYLFAKCNHCGFWFKPSYYDHVRIPRHFDPLEELTKSQLGTVNWEAAQLHCPECGRVPNLDWENREWVQENIDDRFPAAGYQVSPFDAPRIISVPSLVKASVSYKSRKDFVNFNLGLDLEDKDATLMRSDILNSYTSGEVSLHNQFVMGVDCGATYHFVVSAVDVFGKQVVVHKERCPMREAKTVYRRLRMQYRVICTVIDSTPHSTLVMELQDEDRNLFASVYITSKNMTLYTVFNKDEDKEHAKAFHRQVNINRNKAFDGYMEWVRSDDFHVKPSEDPQLEDDFITQHTSMKRVQVYDREEVELEYVWTKTDGNDHFHHASVYCWVAGLIRAVSQPTTGLNLFTMSTLDTRSKTELYSGRRLM